MQFDSIHDTWVQGITPDPMLAVSSWADAHRMLEQKTTSEPGPYRTARTPYLREIMDCLSPFSPIEEVVFMKAAQVGATELGVNWIGYIIHLSPGPMMAVQPTVDLSKRFSRQRISSMIESTPVVRVRVKDARERDSGNTILSKEFDGGILVMPGANSAAGLRSMPVRFLMLDEIDAYPGDLDEEGDPVSIAEKRTTTFCRRKIFKPSTPTVKGQSRIEKEFESSDQRYYHVPCPFCGEYQKLQWSNIIFNKENLDIDPVYKCDHCGELIAEHHKTSMLERGKWIAENPGHPVAGFHLNALYSPLGWKSWKQIVYEHQKATREKDITQLKTWVNTVLAETWEDEADKVDDQSIMSRREPHGADVPDGVIVLTAGVDVQKDRIEAQVVGWGLDSEQWVIDYKVLHGPTIKLQVWNDLGNYLQSTFTGESGGVFSIIAMAIDSGYLPNMVYQFARANSGRRIYVTKGASIAGKPLISKPSLQAKEHVNLYSIGTETAKDMIYSWLKNTEPGGGYIHFSDKLDDEYFRQLTAEKVRTKYVRGFPRREYFIEKGKRNEALDTYVGALVAFKILNPRLGEAANVKPRRPRVISRGIQ